MGFSGRAASVKPIGKILAHWLEARVWWRWEVIRLRARLLCVGERGACFAKWRMGHPLAGGRSGCAQWCSSQLKHRQSENANRWIMPWECLAPSQPSSVIKHAFLNATRRQRCGTHISCFDTYFRSESNKMMVARREFIKVSFEPSPGNIPTLLHSESSTQRLQNDRYPIAGASDCWLRIMFATKCKHSISAVFNSKIVWLI